MATARPDHERQRDDVRPLPEQLRRSEYDADEKSGVWFDPQRLDRLDRLDRHDRNDRDEYAEYDEYLDDDYSRTDYGSRRYAAWRRVAASAE